MKQPDVLIVSCPGLVTRTPVLAPAVLKACALKAGFDAKAIDLNQEVIDFISKKYQETFVFSKRDKNIAKDAFDYCIDRIKKINPKIVAISLLINESQPFAEILCYRIKKELKLPITIGGSGIKTFIAEDGLSFPDKLKKNKLIDNYINGDGEETFVEFLKGNLSYPGINSHSWNPLSDLEKYPFPNFDDYNFGLYQKKAIPICDSRGCVRSCEFCDIIEHWKKYTYRSGKHIFDEMLHQLNAYNIRHFEFYNSLTNGNMKEFNNLLDLICEYNLKNPEQPLSWSGYFIVRNNISHPEELWHKIKLSNGFLELGIESVIESVRIGLGKKFYNVDIDYHLEMSKKYKVHVALLLIMGYPTETIEDFKFTYNWFVDRKKYFGNTIKKVTMSLCAILPNTKLEKKTKEMNVSRGEIPTVWIIPESNVGLTERINHFTKIQNYLKNYELVPKIDKYFELNKEEFQFYMDKQNDQK